MRRPGAGIIALLTAFITTTGCVPGATQEPGSTPSGLATAGPASAAAGSPSPIASLSDSPAGLPVMPGAEAAEPPLDPGTIAQWTVDAIGPDVYAFYLDALPAAGFVITNRFPGGSVAVIRFTTPEGATLDLALVGEGGGDRTRIELGPPEGP
jgi:hypothetical protein